MQLNEIGEIAKKIKDVNTAFVQISIDGNKKTHDYIRGSGNFKKSLKSLKLLKKYMQCAGVLKLPLEH